MQWPIGRAGESQFYFMDCVLRAIVYEVGYVLRRLAVELGCTILTTNDLLPVWDHSRSMGSHGGGTNLQADVRPGDKRKSGSGFEKEKVRFKPALGVQWAGVPHIRVQLHRARSEPAVNPLRETIAFEAVEVLQSSTRVRKLLPNGDRLH